MAISGRERPLVYSRGIMSHPFSGGMSNQAGDITALRNEWQAGSRSADNVLFDRVTRDLRRIAHYRMNRERPDHTLEATEVVDQNNFRLIAAKDRDWRSRQDFFAIADRAMRRYLIDCARGRTAAKFVALEGMEDSLPADSPQIDLALTIDRLLEQLAQTNPAWCRLVEVKYFLGLNDEEAAEILGLNLRTMQRMWRDVRRMLFEQSGSGHGIKSSGTS